MLEGVAVILKKALDSVLLEKAHLFSEDCVAHEKCEYHKVSVGK